MRRSRMLRVMVGIGAAALSLSALAQWEDVNYAGVIPKEYVYCNKQRDLDDFGAAAQDGDEEEANRLVSQGRCHISSGMRVSVFQQNDYAVTFSAPSGKVFYTFIKFVRKK